MAPKVKKSKLQEDNYISEAKTTALKSVTELINFSFKYLDEENKKFPCHDGQAVYYSEILRRLKSICSFKALEFHTNRSSALRAHPIKWIDTTELHFGIPQEDQIIDTPYQFTVGANEHGRIHGFFISNTFYIVWFDKSHALYPLKG